MARDLFSYANVEELKSIFIPSLRICLDKETKPNPLVLDGLPSSETSGCVLIAETASRPPHLETSLEIALRLAIGGYKVAYLHYGAYLGAPCVYESVPRTLESWVKRMSIRYEDFGIKIMSKFAKFHNLNLQILDSNYFASRAMPIESFGPAPSSLEDLKCLSWKDSNLIGISVASLLITQAKTPMFAYENYKSYVSVLINDYKRSYYCVSEAIQSIESVEALIIFNGRFPAAKAVEQLSFEKGIPTFFHERGADKQKFSLRPWQPHNREKLQKEIISAWSSASALNPGSSSELAIQYFKKLRSGKAVGWISYLSEGSISSLNKLINSVKSVSSDSKKIICFFASSDDEYESVDDVIARAPSEWPTQKHMLIHLVDVCAEIGIQVIVRVHPRLAKINSPDLQVWNQLQFLPRQSQNVFVVPSDSDISSYDLIDQVDAVVTGHSTVGIEAVYWGKSAIVMGDPFYDKIGASIYQVRTREKLKECLSNLHNLKVSSESALPYGYYMATFGERFQLYEAADLFSGKFIGINLQVFDLTSWWLFLKKCKSFLRMLFSL